MKRKKRVALSLISGIIIVLVLMIPVYFFSYNRISGLIAALMVPIIAQGIYSLVDEWKSVLFLAVSSMAIGFLGSSSLNTLMIVLLFNIVYINWYFEPQWRERQNRIEEKTTSTKEYVFDRELFERNKQRNLVISKLFGYAFSVLPAIALDLLKQYKDEFDVLSALYGYALRFLHLGINTPTPVKRVCFAPFLIFAFLFISVFIALIMKEPKGIRAGIINKRSRGEAYWGNIKPDLDEEDLVYIDKSLS